jgi:hypothetical protein
MGFDRSLFVDPSAVDGYECAICHDVVEEPSGCTKGHTCAPCSAAATKPPHASRWLRTADS